VSEPRSVSEDQQCFRDTPALQVHGLGAHLCPPDECEGSTMLYITECENGEPCVDEDGNDFCVYVSLEEALALRDWLNKVLP